MIKYYIKHREETKNNPFFDQNGLCSRLTEAGRRPGGAIDPAMREVGKGQDLALATDTDPSIPGTAVRAHDRPPTR
ncbi:MAG: hypothetical protein KIT47_04415, partial [Rhodoferax sp.]|nr:hypothetical protein [Rhodoferax sp.]